MPKPRKTAKGQGPWLPRRDRARAIEKIQQEAEGLLNIEVYEQPEADAIRIQALAGDPRAVRAWHAITNTIAKIKEAAKSRQPMLCATCDAEVHRAGFVIVAIYPHIAAPSTAVLACVCYSCVAKAENDPLLAAQHCAKKIWPDSRPIDVTPGQSGTA